MHIHNHGLSLELLAVGNNANSPGGWHILIQIMSQLISPAYPYCTRIISLGSPEVLDESHFCWLSYYKYHYHISLHYSVDRFFTMAV